jgi:hypothetical protein
MSRPINQRRLLVVVSILLAFVTGYNLGFRWTVAWTARSALKRLADSDFYAASLSVAGLDRLESGDIDGAKRLLARDLSGYFRSKAKEVPSSHEAVLLQQMEKTSEHSTILKEMLAKPTQ